MPNGGSDCCGTCWFNRTNRGERDWMRARDDSIPPYCEIRSIAIEVPFYTYCVNHPHRRPERDPIPIGPVMRGDSQMNRSVWIASPDSEEVRKHLLDILDDIFIHMSKDRYPAEPSLAEVVISQLGEFREERAISGLERIRDNGPDFLAEMARVSLEKILGQYPSAH